MNTNDLRRGMEELVRDIPDPDYAHRAWRQARRTRHRRRWSIAAVAATAVVGVGAAPWVSGLLASTNDETSHGQSLDQTEEPPPFATYQGREHMLALWPAKILLEDGCIYLTDLDTETVRIPLLAPDDTQWDPSRQELSLDGETVRIGDVGQFGGGQVDADRADHIPANCRGGRNLDSLTFFQVGSLPH